MAKTQRLKVLDYREYGKIVVKWAKDPNSRPQTLSEFKDAVKNVLVVPDTVTENPHYIQWSNTNLIVRLPAVDLVEESENDLKKSPDHYPLPLFYHDLVSGEVAGLDGFYYRVGDYTTAQCA